MKRFLETLVAHGVSDVFGQMDFYGRRFVGANLDNPSWAEVALSMGLEGVCVERLEDRGEAFCRLAKHFSLVSY